MRPVIFSLLIVLAAPIAICAQTPTPAFEVAAIRLNNDPPPQMGIGAGLRNGTLHAAYQTLRSLLAAAYGFSEPRIIGPDWLDKNRFDIFAKAPSGVPDSEMKPMLQALLKDRFKLSAHFEARMMPVYYLGVAKGGVKMHLYPEPDGAPEHYNADPKTRCDGSMRGTGTVSQFLPGMSKVAGRPIIDKTGLAGRYNYFLCYAAISSQAVETVSEFGPADFFTAVEKQLGLKLESAKDNVEVVVVDHMEQMPTEN